MDIIQSVSTIKNFMVNASRTTCNEYLYEALSVAVGDIERYMMPKRSIKVKAGANGETDGCPICDNPFWEKVNFCPNCGRKIDWSIKESEAGEIPDSQEAAKKMAKMINDFFDKKDDACNLICQLAEKLDAYERLGPIEELEDLKDRDTPMRPAETEGIFGNPTYECKNCGNELEASKFSAVYCHWCGQKLDWSKHD